METSAVPAQWRCWLDPHTPQVLVLFLLDDSRGDQLRPALPSMLWLHIARFLRFPGPMQMVYLFGGRRRLQDGQETCLDTVEAFDWWHRDWVAMPPMSFPRVGADAAVLGRLVVVAGGYGVRSTEPLDSVEAFDTLGGTWRELPPMPTRRYGLALACIGSRIYAIGGDDGQRVCTANEVFDQATSSWVRVAPLPRPLAGGKAEAHNGLIYYVGGCDQNEELSAATFVYTPVVDRWDYACMPCSNERLNLRIGRTSFAMALLGESTASARAGYPARLLVTGGVSGRPDELFLADTELLALGASGPSGSSSSPGCQGCPGSPGTDGPFGGECGAELPAWLAGVPPMPQPRSGCRSLVLWPRPRRSYLPWADEEPRAAPAAPFAVVLGGETPCFDEGLVMRPCREPVVLDLAAGRWHTALPKGGTPAEVDAEGCSDQSSFLSVVGRLQTSRVAFALAVAPGIPRVATHGG